MCQNTALILTSKHGTTSMVVAHSSFTESQRLAATWKVEGAWWELYNSQGRDMIDLNHTFAPLAIKRPCCRGNRLIPIYTSSTSFGYNDPRFLATLRKNKLIWVMQSLLVLDSEVLGSISTWWANSWVRPQASHTQPDSPCRVVEGEKSHEESHTNNTDV